MADTATKGTETDTEAESGGGNKKLLLIGLAVGVIAALAAGYFLFGGGSAEAAEPVEPPPPTFSDEPGPIVLVDETTVSLGGAEAHFAAVTYSAVLAMDADPALVEADFARLRSAAQLVFRSSEADVLDTAEGFHQLQRDLTDAAAEVWPHGEVLEVLVEALLVQ